MKQLYGIVKYLPGRTEPFIELDDDGAITTFTEIEEADAAAYKIEEEMPEVECVVISLNQVHV